tara:strand:- start:2002 stop:2214 length:213 start_codon:yes stop_codon:yes gene_type:complete
MSQQQTNTHTQQQKPINELQHLPRNRPTQPANPFQEQSQRLNTGANPGRSHSFRIGIDQHQHKPTEYRIN